MGLLAKLKAVFGAGSDERSGSSGDADVTVEYAPDAESEHAVKGTDEADVSAGSTADEAAEPDPSVEADATETDESGEETDESDTVTDDAETAGEGDTPASPGVEEVKGIGPTYSDRLGDVDIETVGDLAAADAEAVAEAAEVSASRAEDWIERAQSRT